MSETYECFDEVMDKGFCTELKYKMSKPLQLLWSFKQNRRDYTFHLLDFFTILASFRTYDVLLRPSEFLGYCAKNLRCNVLGMEKRSGCQCVIHLSNLLAGEKIL